MGLVSIRLYRLRGPFQVTVLIDIYIYIYIMIIMALTMVAKQTPFFAKAQVCASSSRSQAGLLGLWHMGPPKAPKQGWDRV